jgi:hypothetical protein
VKAVLENYEIYVCILFIRWGNCLPKANYHPANIQRGLFTFKPTIEGSVDLYQNFQSTMY